MLSNLPKHLMLVGASVRAAAMSARQAGFTVSAVDLFNDADLLPHVRTAARIAADTYPAGIIRAARRVLRDSDSAEPVDGIVWTGGLENHPRVLRQLAGLAPVFGCAPATVARVRSPWRLVDALVNAELPGRRIAFPAICRQAPGLAGDSAHRWLRKRYRSAAGLGVSMAHLASGKRTAPPADRAAPRAYYQRYVEGQNVSAAYVTNGLRCVLLGTTRQWCGAEVRGNQPWAPAGFVYTASVWDQRRTAAELQQWRQLGTTCARHFGLRGLFGVDAVRQPARDSGPGWLYVVEVNPRYTASMELWERAHHDSLLRSHVRACLPEESGRFLEEIASPAVAVAPAWGKRILYAPARLSLGADAVGNLSRWQPTADVPLCVADVPARPTTLAPGQPVCTVLASAPDSQAVAELLGLDGNSATLSRLLRLTIGES